MNIFVELLQMSLGTRNMISRTPSESEWEIVYDEAQRHAITGVMLDGIEKLSADQRPPIDLLLEWIGEVHIIEATNEQHQEMARNLTRRFGAAGFRSCVLKGVGTGLLYPNPLRRQGGDIDLWVDGYRKDVTNWIQTQCDIGHVTWHHIDAHFFENISIEIHFKPSWLYNPLHYRRIKRYFEDKKLEQMRERDEGFNYPTPVFNAVFSLTHAFHHFLEEGVGFRHMIDYFFIVKNLTSKEREEVMRVITNLKMTLFLSSMMYVLHYACGMPNKLLLCLPNEKEGKFLLSEVQAAGNFGLDRKGDELKHNSIKRFWVMFKHYPSEVIWMIPFKIRNKVWKSFYKYL